LAIICGIVPLQALTKVVYLVHSPHARAAQATYERCRQYTQPPPAGQSPFNADNYVLKAGGIALAVQKAFVDLIVNVPAAALTPLPNGAYQQLQRVCWQPGGVHVLGEALRPHEYSVVLMIHPWSLVVCNIAPLVALHYLLYPACLIFLI
jgi:hypothetical protein